jgi:hypothetical protein
MKTNEKFSVLDAVITATRMTEKKLKLWYEKRQSASADPINSIFPIVYKIGNGFEVLPEFISSRKHKIWGYELLPGIILAKKCGADGNVESMTWNNCKAFAGKMSLNGKCGSLPSKKVLKQNWSEELIGKIQAMDKFLCKNGVNAESRSGGYYCGILCCSEVDDDPRAYSFDLRSCDGHWFDKTLTLSLYRLAVAF